MLSLLCPSDFVCLFDYFLNVNLTCMKIQLKQEMGNENKQSTGLLCGCIGENRIAESQADLGSNPGPTPC